MSSLGGNVAPLASLVRERWPWRNSESRIAAVQFQLEVEPMRRVDGEKDGDQWAH